MHYHYNKNLPLAPRTLLYPLFGKRALKGPIGIITDSCCLLAVIAGTVGPIGFLALQLAYGLDFLFNIPNTLELQLTIITTLVTLYTVSAATGINRGIQFLSKANIILGFVLLLYLLTFGPTAFIFTSFFKSMGFYLQHFFSLALYREGNYFVTNEGWLSSWTLFFWGWFLGYGPIMAIFITRISRGRSIRSVILMLSVIAPLITNFWFTAIGGSAIAAAKNGQSVAIDSIQTMIVSALFTMTKSLPLGTVISLLFMLLTFIFTATTADSISYVVSQIISRTEKVSLFMRIFWGLSMGGVASILLATGAESLSQLQNVIIITAIPVSFILLPSLWNGTRIIFSYTRANRKMTN